ncbi:MAG: outer membrane protein assembly factor BamE [Pseudomonadales bacterium]
MRISLVAIIICLGLSIGGCSSLIFPGVYRIQVPQGNVITEEMVAKLKPGMTRRQVRFVMGTPLIEDTFNKDRWDYVYTVRRARKVTKQAKISLVFDGDRLVSYSGDYVDDIKEKQAQANTETEQEEEAQN